jgi:hypothetical protein
LQPHLLRRSAVQVSHCSRPQVALALVDCSAAPRCLLPAVCL